MCVCVRIYQNAWICDAFNVHLGACDIIAVSVGLDYKAFMMKLQFMYASTVIMAYFGFRVFQSLLRMIGLG